MNTEREKLQAQVVEQFTRIAEQMDTGDMTGWDELVERLRGTPIFERACQDVMKTHPEFRGGIEKLMSLRRGEAAT